MMAATSKAVPITSITVVFCHLPLRHAGIMPPLNIIAALCGDNTTASFSCTIL